MAAGSAWTVVPPAPHTLGSFFPGNIFTGSAASPPLHAFLPQGVAVPGHSMAPMPLVMTALAPGAPSLQPSAPPRPAQPAFLHPPMVHPPARLPPGTHRERPPTAPLIQLSTHVRTHTGATGHHEGFRLPLAAVALRPRRFSAPPMAPAASGRAIRELETITAVRANHSEMLGLLRRVRKLAQYGYIAGLEATVALALIVRGDPLMDAAVNLSILDAGFRIRYYLAPLVQHLVRQRYDGAPPSSGPSSAAFTVLSATASQESSPRSSLHAQAHAHDVPVVRPSPPSSAAPRTGARTPRLHRTVNATAGAPVSPPVSAAGHTSTRRDGSAAVSKVQWAATGEHQAPRFVAEDEDSVGTPRGATAEADADGSPSGFPSAWADGEPSSSAFQAPGAAVATTAASRLARIAAISGAAAGKRNRPPTASTHHTRITDVSESQNVPAVPPMPDPSFIAHPSQLSSIPTGVADHAGALPPAIVSTESVFQRAGGVHMRVVAYSSEAPGAELVSSAGRATSGSTSPVAGLVSHLRKMTTSASLGGSHWGASHSLNPFMSHGSSRLSDAAQIISGSRESPIAGTYSRGVYGSMEDSVSGRLWRARGAGSAVHASSAASPHGDLPGASFAAESAESPAVLPGITGFTVATTDASDDPYASRETSAFMVGGRMATAPAPAPTSISAAVAPAVSALASSAALGRTRSTEWDMRERRIASLAPIDEAAQTVMPAPPLFATSMKLASSDQPVPDAVPRGRAGRPAQKRAARAAVGPEGTATPAAPSSVPVPVTAMHPRASAAAMDHQPADRGDNQMDIDVPAAAAPTQPEAVGGLPAGTSVVPVQVTVRQPDGSLAPMTMAMALTPAGPVLLAPSSVRERIVHDTPVAVYPAAPQTLGLPEQGVHSAGVSTPAAAYSHAATGSSMLPAHGVAPSIGYERGAAPFAAPPPSAGAAHTAAIYAAPSSTPLAASRPGGSTVLRKVGSGIIGGPRQF